MEMGETAEMKVIVGDEGVDECNAFCKRRGLCDTRWVKVFVEERRELGREGGIGEGGDETPLLKVKQGLALGAVVEGLDTEMASDGKEEGDRKRCEIRVKR
jgi:hypothetical protein